MLCEVKIEGCSHCCFCLSKAQRCLLVAILTLIFTSFVGGVFIWLILSQVFSTFKLLPFEVMLAFYCMWAAASLLLLIGTPYKSYIALVVFFVSTLAMIALHVIGLLVLMIQHDLFAEYLRTPLVAVTFTAMVIVSIFEIWGLTCVKSYLDVIKPQLFSKKSTEQHDDGFDPTKTFGNAEIHLQYLTEYAASLPSLLFDDTDSIVSQDSLSTAVDENSLYQSVSDLSSSNNMSCAIQNEISVKINKDHKDENRASISAAKLLIPTTEKSAEENMAEMIDHPIVDDGNNYDTNSQFPRENVEHIIDTALRIEKETDANDTARYVITGGARPKTSGKNVQPRINQGKLATQAGHPTNQPNKTPSAVPLGDLPTNLVTHVTRFMQQQSTKQPQGVITNLHKCSISKEPSERINVQETNESANINQYPSTSSTPSSRHNGTHRTRKRPAVTNHYLTVFPTDTRKSTQSMQSRKKSKVISPNPSFSVPTNQNVDDNRFEKNPTRQRSVITRYTIDEESPTNKVSVGNDGQSRKTSMITKRTIEDPLNIKSSHGDATRSRKRSVVITKYPISPDSSHLQRNRSKKHSVASTIVLQNPIGFSKKRASSEPLLVNIGEGSPNEKVTMPRTKVLRIKATLPPVQREQVG